MSIGVFEAFAIFVALTFRSVMLSVRLTTNVSRKNFFHLRIFVN
jgi:hypothetical protein